MSKAVVLLSGGLDSLVTLALALHKGKEVYPLGFYYGQRATRELRYAVLQVAHYQNVYPELIHDIKHMSIVMSDVISCDMTNHRDGAEIKDPYVPNRNAIMCSLGAAYAESIGAAELWMGLITADEENEVSIALEDASEEFVLRMNYLLELSMRDPVKLVAPLVKMKKHEVITLGRKMKAPMSMSWSCYQPEDGTHSPCGKCSACVDRTFAIAKAGLRI